MKDDLLEILDLQPWESVLINLMAYAVWLCDIQRTKLPTSVQPEDLVMDIIDKVYSRERKWDYEAEPDLLAYLKSAVKSHLSNEMRVLRNNHQSLNNFEILDKPGQNQVDEELYCKQLDEKIITSMRGDPEMCLVYKCLKDGLKPTEIVQEFGVKITTIQNAQRRLRYLILKIIPSGKRAKNITNGC